MITTLVVDRVSLKWNQKNQNNRIKGKNGENRELNPGPPAPEAGIIPLDYSPLIEHSLECVTIMVKS